MVLPDAYEKWERGISNETHGQLSKGTQLFGRPQLTAYLCKLSCHTIRVAKVLE